MPDESKLSAGQKLIVSGLPGWELTATHSNGDITVKTDGKYYRITKEGKIVFSQARIEAKRATGPVAKPYQPSLSEELTAAVKVTPIKVEKKTEYKPPYKPYSSKTVCQETPECCRSRKIKAVFLDADHTIWDLQGTAASVTGKLKKVDDDTVVELSEYKTYGTPYSGYELSVTEEELLKGLSGTEKDFLLKELEKEHGSTKKAEPEKKKDQEHIRTTIKLDPTFRHTLDELEKRKIPSSIISLNTPGSVKRILKEFGLDHRFAEIRDSYENKGKVFKELAHKQGICPCDGLFVDDNRTNTEPVAEKCGIAIQIGKGKDIEKISDLLKYIEEPS